MRQDQQILAYIEENTWWQPQFKGLTTQEVALALNLQRSNASRDLNALVRAGKIQKVAGRPVNYVKNPLSKKPVLPAKKHVRSYMEQSEKPPVKTASSLPSPTVGDVFTRIVGAKGSMRNAIEQAKAAILYPPKGLNCLITGPTGSGKTFFAHAMFQFAKGEGVLKSHKELTVFNCADYANNPELLMSHLFGHVKGAFTGAQQEKTGIMDEADGGMLFLDEIHRLPPAGQEMIFYFMDHGTFSRLGETTKQHQADVRIIGATTEDPSSSLLATFVRRIPINIQLPTFDKRPALEKVELVKILVAQEAKRIQREISLTEDVVKALLGSVSYGNIGQLKSNIQLVCARGFLNHMQQEVIAITLQDLPENLRNGLTILANRREAFQELAPILEPKLRVSPHEEFMTIAPNDNYELPYNLYDIIGDKAALLKADGLDQEAINHFISTDINIHLKSFYQDHGFSFDTTNKLAEFVDPKIIDCTYRIYEMVKSELGYGLQSNFIYALSLHISSFLKKLQDGEVRQTNDNILQMVASYPEEFAIAKKIRDYIADCFQVAIPENEIDYLAVLLISLRAHQKEGKIGVVVAAHGSSTASSMVQVVKQLLAVDHIVAVDMPLDMAPNVALKKIEAAVLAVHEENGVLLLVDMGSLATFTEKITEATKVEVRTLDMVTTALVLEAARKAAIVGTDLGGLVESLEQFRGYGGIKETPRHEHSLKKQGILAICASGLGTAQRIKEIIQNALTKKQQETLEILPLSVVDLKTQLPQLQRDYQVIATTGIVDPKINAPFISLDRFINQDVKTFLEEVIPTEDFKEVLTEDSPILNEEKAYATTEKFLLESTTFINPKKLLPTLWQFVMDILKDEGFSEEYSLAINLAMHTASMLERIVLRAPLALESEKKAALLEDSRYPRLHLHVISLERFLHLEIPVEEEYYLLEILKLKREKEVYLNDTQN